MNSILASEMKKLLVHSKVLSESQYFFELKSSKDAELTFLKKLCKIYDCYLITDDYYDYDPTHDPSSVLYLYKNTDLNYLYDILLEGGGWILVASCNQHLKNIDKNDFKWKSFPPNHVELSKVFQKYSLDICIASFWDDIKWYICAQQ